MMMSARRDQEEFELDPAEIEAELRATLKRWGLETTGDGRVFEDTAARLLMYSAMYLRNMRQEGKGPRALKVAGRISYRITDIARWIVQNTELA